MVSYSTRNRNILFFGANNVVNSILNTQDWNTRLKVRHSYKYMMLGFPDLWLMSDRC